MGKKHYFYVVKTGNQKARIVVSEISPFDENIKLLNSIHGSKAWKFAGCVAPHFIVEQKSILFPDKKVLPLAEYIPLQ